MTISENLQSIQKAIAAAATRSGRDPSAITLVAVTKTHPAETVTEAFHAGLRHFGENKVQEARAKIDPSASGGLWHLIGHLQTNKAKLAAHLFDRIDSVDSAELAQLLSRTADDLGKNLPVLIQVNVVGESQKFGVAPENVSSLAETINHLPALELQGLMIIPPFFEETENVRPCLARLRELRDRVEKETGLHLPELSMGMSHDFVIAIEEGSTQVRLGTALFGTRQPSRLSRPSPLEG